MDLEDLLEITCDGLKLSSESQITIMKYASIALVKGIRMIQHEPAYPDAVLAAHGDHRAAIVLEDGHVRLGLRSTSGLLDTCWTRTTLSSKWREI